MEVVRKSQDFGSVLRAQIEAAGLTNKTFAEAARLKATTLSNYLNNVSRPNFEILISFTKILGVSADYLLGIATQSATGPSKAAGKASEGTAVDKISPQQLTASKAKGTTYERATPTTDLRVLVTTVDSAGHDNIALVSTRVAAGYARGGSVEPEFIKDLPTFSLPSAVYRNGSFRAFQVSGDSMQPTLHDGDWVICRYVDNWVRDIQDMAVHVVVTHDIPVVKRLLNQLNERGQLTLQSDSVAYPTQFLYGEEVREVWVAVARLSREFVNPRYDLMKEMSRTRADVDELLARISALEATKAH